jgi:hypothetical protein
MVSLRSCSLSLIDWRTSDFIAFAELVYEKKGSQEEMGYQKVTGRSLNQRKRELARGKPHRQRPYLIPDP